MEFNYEVRIQINQEGDTSKGRLVGIIKKVSFPTPVSEGMPVFVPILLRETGVNGIEEKYLEVEGKARGLVNIAASKNEDFRTVFELYDRVSAEEFEKMKEEIPAMDERFIYEAHYD